MNTNKDIVRSYYEDLWNAKDKSYIDSLFSDDLVFRSSLGTNVKGKKEFEEYFDMILKAIPDLDHGIEILVADGNRVVARAIYNGTHQGKLFDYEPTKNLIRYNGASFFTIKNNKITDIWVLADLKALFGQLVK